MFDIFRRPSAQLQTAEPSGAGEPQAGGSAADDARRELFEKISDFVCRHDLLASPGNIALIASALSGSNAELAAAFAARQISGAPMDQRWLDTLDRLNPASERRTAELELLVEKLDDTLMRFGQSARFAKDATSDHRGAIGAQISAMATHSPADDARQDIDRLLELSGAMLERLELIETALERSHSETEDLRRHLAEARLEADVDHLTGLPNRRAFERRFAMAASAARSRNQPLSVAFCDVDHFKLVNDCHGHDAGDRVLRMIAGTLGERANDRCFVVRHGGEEFVLLFPGLDKRAALDRVDAMRRALAGRNLINRATGKPFGRITFSGGVAEIGDDADDRSALARADAALYRAKQDGRNRIAIG